MEWISGSLLLVGLTGKPIAGDGGKSEYHVEFGNSRMVHAKHLISYGGNFRHMEVNCVLPGARRQNEGGAYFQAEILLSEHFRWVVGTRIDKFDSLRARASRPARRF